MVCIMLNTCVLAFDWYNIQDDVKSVLNYFNYGFAAIVTKNQPTSEAQPNGRYCITTEIARVEGFRSRACAKTHAHKLVRYHKAQSN